MQIDFLGGNCVRVKTKQVRIVFDDNLKALGKKTVTISEDVSCVSNVSIVGENEKSRISFCMPGEYEVGDTMVSGIAAQAHIDEKGTKNATIFRAITPEFKFAVVGHIAADISEDQLEAIGVVDILFIPVGGGGYTLDAVSAAKIAKQIDAKLVVPTHYDDKSLTFEVPQTSPEEFIKIMGLDVRKVGSSTIKLKKSDLGEKAEVLLFE